MIRKSSRTCAAALALFSIAFANINEERFAPGEIRAEAVAPSREIPPVLIRGVSFDGADVPENVADAARPFIARTATQKTLNDLAAAMTQAYAASEVVFFSVNIPPQSFKDGIVRVHVTEGRISTVSFSGETDGRNHRLITAYAERLAAPERASGPTTRAALERNMSLARDIPGLIIKPTLQQGEKPDEVVMDLALDYQRPTISFGFNNRTTRLVRDGQFTALGKAYRLLRDGDLTTMRLAAAVNFKDSLQAGISHSTPLGDAGLRGEVSAAIVRSKPSGTPVTGDAQIYGAAVSAPLVRSYKRNLVVRAGLDAVNSDNAAFGSLIAMEQTRALRLAAQYAETSEAFSYRLRGEVAQGMAMLGAEISPNIGEPQYTKVSVDAGLTRKFGTSVYMRINGAGQWTDNLLPANERFSLGGANYGRAFDTAFVNADRGFAFSLEPAWRPISSGDFSDSEIYLFADYAQADVFSRNGGDTLDLDFGSYGAGVRAAYDDKGVLELEIARVYDQPVADFDQDWRFSVGWRIDIKP